MSNEFAKHAFLQAAKDWVCEAYALDIRYIASESSAAARIWQASITLSPLRAASEVGFQVKSSSFRLGQIQQFPVKKKVLLDVLTRAANGAIDLPDGTLILQMDQPLDLYSEMSHRERWFSELHLQVAGSHIQMPAPMELARIDNTLRASEPPFDGLADAAGWLGLSPPEATTTPPSIEIRVSPPCDLMFDQCTLANDHLHLVLHAHPKFDVSRVGLAIRAAPGMGLHARRQISDEIEWGQARGGRRRGIARVDLERADSALAMLMIGSSTVRRQWFIDPAKARNNRLLAVQYFDRDLRMTRHAVLEATDSTKFEQGVAALLFLLGFSPSVQLETASPDLIVTTPGGKLAIVECTIRIADFAAKMGKLVDRRGALVKALNANGHPIQVIAVLACRLPRDQIAAQAENLRAHNIILVTGEDLATGFERVRHSNDPDRILDESLARLAGHA